MEHCGIRPWPPNSFPAYPSCFDTYNSSPNGPGKVGELDDAPSSASSARTEQEQAFREKQQRRKMRKAHEEAKVTRAELIPGNRGDQDVEKLLDFITGNNNSKKGVKKKQLTGSSGINVAHAQENGLVEKSNKVKKTPNEKAQSKSGEEGSSENNSDRGDDTSSKVTDLGEEKVKDNDLVDNAKVSDNGSEGSISSDLIKDITAKAAKLDNNKHIKYQKGNKIEVDDTYFSGGEGPLNGSSVDIYPTSLVNDTYIFTDYDSVSLPVEEDFVTVVGTKKKKVRSIGQSSNNYHKDTPFNGSGSQHYSSYRESSLPFMGDNRPSGVGAQLAQLPSKGDDRRPPRPSHPMTRSVTPPPSTYSNSLQTDSSSNSNRRSHNKASRDRAFSPSSSLAQNKSEEEEDFPVINNQSNDFPSLPTATKSHEGRRNSTGNVPSEVSPDVDSDMESVKSLPLASSNQRDDGSSPRGSGTSNIISYARIAAGPRGGGKTMSMSNSTSTASVNSVPSSTVWNSTQNRGNQIADVTKQHDEGYVTTDNAVESSLSNTVSASSSKSEELSSLSGFEGNIIKSENDKFTPQSPELTTENLTNAQHEPEIIKNSDKEIGKPTAEIHTISSAISTGDESSSSISKNHKADVNKVKPVINDIVTSEDDAVPDVSTTSIKAITATGKRSGKPKSSVVFLDRKMNNSPKDMEISFGFDEDMENQTKGSDMQIQFGENVQDMQFGGPTITYPAGGYVSGVLPVAHQEMCAVKGAVPGMNGVINPQEIMAYPPPPHAIGIPVNMAQPPPGHLMMVPPPVAPTSGQMMMPPPTMAVPSAQFIPVPPTGVPPSQVVASVPPPVPIAALDSPVMFVADGEHSREKPDQKEGNALECEEVAPRADVSNEVDFPPLSATVNKSVGAPTSTSAAAAVNDDTPAVISEAVETRCVENRQSNHKPEIEFLQPSLPDQTEQEGSTMQQQQQQQMEVENNTENLKKFWPSRDNDLNYDCGNFMVEQAVFYLKKGRPGQNFL